MTIKVAPGKYQVWVRDVCVTFKTERDANRFMFALQRGAVSE